MASGYYSYLAVIAIYRNHSQADDVYYTKYENGRAYVEQGQGFAVYVQLPSSEQYTREGYDFIGYSTSRNGSVVYNPGDYVPFYFSAGGGTVVNSVFCVWRLKTYTVAFDANGGENAPTAQTKTHGVDLALTSAVPTRSNYRFVGWGTSSTGSAVYQPGDTFSVDADTTLYAIWVVAGGELTSVSDTAIEGTGTANWTKVNNTHAYKLKLSFVDAPVVTVNVAANATSCQFTIPASWYDYIPGSVSGTALATLETYTDANYGTYVGSTTKTFTVSVADSVVPDISAFTATPHSQNNVVEGWGVAAQGYSYATLAVSAVAGAGASILDISFSGFGINQSGLSASGDTSILTNVGVNTFTVTVTDSRGRTATETVDLTVYEYSTPVITSFETVRCLSNGTASDTEGDYLKSLPVFMFSSVNGHNSLSVKKIEYRQHGASTWVVGIASAVSGSWSAVFGPADITKVFDVKCTITDDLGNTYALEIIVPPVIGFAIGLNNDRARFGGPCAEEGLVCDWDFKLVGDFVMRDGNGNSVTLTYSDLVALLALLT